MQHESATIPTGTASLSMTSRQTKKLVTNAPNVQDLAAKERWTRIKNRRMASIWKRPHAQVI
jgi:hypothetical protein